MSRRILVSLCGLLALAAAPWAQAETVKGYFEGLVGPPGANYATGAAGITGWAVATTGIAKVVIQVDGVDVGQAFYGAFRPDVTAAQPGFVDSPAPGFGYFLNSTDFPNAPHDVTAKVYTYGGSVVILPQTYSIVFNNNPSIVRPFGAIERPLRNQDLFGNCGPALNPILTPITGWALDLGVEIGDEGIGYVELMVDQVPIFNTRLHCRYSAESGGLTQCYGLPRQDIEAIYPYTINSPSAGFRFVLDVGALIAFSGYTEGNHTLTIRAGDILTNVENIAEIPVNFFCTENLPNASSFGQIESPRGDRAYEGDILFQGWALDIDGVNHVDVHVDGNKVGTASFGLDTRPSVLVAYPGYPNSLAPVWRFTWDSTTLGDGVRQLQVFAFDNLGGRSLIGEQSFFVDNVRDNQ